MDYAPPAAKVVLFLMELVVVCAALEDVRQLKISNVFPLAVVGCFVGWVTLVGFRTSLWENGVSFILVLAVGLVLFSLKGLGGGDVKLLAALALWFDLAGLGRMLVFMAIGGGLLALALIAVRRTLPMPASGWVALRKRGPIPYGVAIAAGALLAIHLVGVSPKPVSSMERFHQMGLFVKKQS